MSGSDASAQSTELAIELRGIGSMHHIALKATPENYRAVVERLRRQEYPFSLHGSEEQGSVYLRDPDGILVEITTGYDL